MKATEQVEATQAVGADDEDVDVVEWALAEIKRVREAEGPRADSYLWLADLTHLAMMTRRARTPNDAKARAILEAAYKRAREAETEAERA